MSSCTAKSTPPRESRRTIQSLALPALNEEETVGHVIKTLKHALLDKVPLLDEIAQRDVHAELAELEALGLLKHPHTSAGRVPTDKAYRYYVEQSADQPWCVGVHS